MTPDWYPDPFGRYEFRYHNGERWTSDVAVDGVRYVDPTPGPPSGVPTTMAVPHPPGVPMPVPGKGRAILAFLFGLGAVLLGWTPFLFVIGAGMGIAALVLGAQVLRRSRRDGVVGAPRGFAITALVLAPIGLGLCVVGAILSVVVLREVERYVEPGRHEVDVTECSVEGGMATATGTIRNQDDDDRGYVVSVVFSEDGVDLASESVEVDDVSPGGSATWTARRFTGPVDSIDCVIDDVTGPYPFGLESSV